MLERYGEILTIDEACEVLMVGRSRMYELLRKKKLQAFRIGTIWKIPKIGIQNYILEQTGIKKQ